MHAEILIPQILKHLINGIDTVNVTGRTIGECLNDLVSQFPQLRTRLFKSNNELADYYEVFINGKSAYPNELLKPVNDGDRIVVVNIIEGG